MRYENLQDLLDTSSSTRLYFLSLPVDIQMSLHERDRYIHTAEELRRIVGSIENYKHICERSGWKE